MTWDVFVSYASEDKSFVRRLAHGLTAAGLHVWFDETALEAGDSLRRSIDKGLKESQYGVVVLSNNFFMKEWPQRELDGLTARDDGNSKVIIPVWYNISADDVRAYSLPLADKLSIYSTGSVKGVVAKILRAIQKDRVGALGWEPTFASLTEGTELVILPLRPRDEHAVCIGRYPVLNKEYRRFTDETGADPPIGEEYKNGAWHGPFVLWDHEEFSQPEQPVTCVTLKDIYHYFQWLKSKDNHVFLPTGEVWNIASAGYHLNLFHNYKHNIDFSDVHHRSSHPAVIDRSGKRDNPLGVSDLIGNVWEWIGGDYWPGTRLARLDAPRRHMQTDIELRGGGYLDNLENVNLFLRASMLDDGVQTSHIDLGFRIGARIPLSSLPQSTVALLETQQYGSDSIYETLYYAQRFFGEYYDYWIE